jgi:RNA polymerase sigma factor (sigma-70 family)
MIRARRKRYNVCRRQRFARSAANAREINRFGAIVTDSKSRRFRGKRPAGSPAHAQVSGGETQHGRYSAVCVPPSVTRWLRSGSPARESGGRSAGSVNLDAATIDAARLGNRAARGALLAALQDAWYRFSLSLLRDPDLARDAVQETALRFLRQLPKFRGQSRLRTWSLGIALNVVREMRRKRRDDRTLPAEDAAEMPMTPPAAAGRDTATAEAAAEWAEERNRLRAVLDELPDRQREAVVLRFFEDLSVEETAKAMGCAAGTVKATVHQALAALRRKLKVAAP